MSSFLSFVWNWFITLPIYGELAVGFVFIAVVLFLLVSFYAKVLVPALTFFSDHQ